MKQGGASPPASSVLIWRRSEGDLHRRTDDPAIHIVAAGRARAERHMRGIAIAIVFLEVDIGTERVQSHTLGQRVADAGKVLVQLFMRTGIRDRIVVFVVDAPAPHIGEGEAPGTGLVGDTGIPSLTVSPEAVILLGKRTTNGEASIADIQTSAPD